jgi:hypothetical protein
MIGSSIEKVMSCQDIDARKIRSENYSGAGAVDCLVMVRELEGTKCVASTSPKGKGDAGTRFLIAVYISA